MKLNKEKFLKSELGGKLQECVAVWDYWLAKINESYETRTDVERYQAQWEVFQTVLRQFYNVEYHFTRTDEYFGVCTENEADWLFKVERELKRNG